MNENKKEKKVIILLIIFGIFISLIGMFFTVIFFNKNTISINNNSSNTIIEEKYTEKEVKNILNDKGIDEEKATEKEKDVILLGLCESDFDDARLRLYGTSNNSKELPDDIAEQLYNKILTDYMNKDYINVIETVDDVLKNYNLTTEKNCEISGLYNDAIWLNYYYSVNEDEKYNILANCKNPLGFLINSIYISPKYKLSYYIDGQGICVYLNNNEYITNIKSEYLDLNNDPLVLKYKETHARSFINIRNVIKYDVSFSNDTNVTYYILEECDGDYYILTATENETNTYLTANEWR